MRLAKPFCLLACAGFAVVASVAASEPERVDKIVVNKAKRELLLCSNGKVIRTYKIALGSTPKGAKQMEGDGKTPEGLYVISGRNPASKFHRSLRVSYPNANDIAAARKLGKPPGGDIMVHGLPNAQAFVGKLHTLHDWTAGCIAVTNEEIEEIWRLVKDGTPIQINA